MIFIATSIKINFTYIFFFPDDQETTFPLSSAIEIIVLLNVDWTYAIPFSIFWLRASFKAIPNSLSEAAMIEGADRLTILIKILLPQMIGNFYNNIIW